MYEIIGYETQLDFDNRRGEVVSEHTLPSTAIKNAETFLRSGNYEVIKVQSTDREFIQIFKRNEFKQLEEIVDVNLKKAIDDVFQFSHEFAGTKSGDITPEQQSKLDSLTSELKKLIVTQTLQNI